MKAGPRVLGQALMAGAPYELVRGLLRSPNPEARVYAVEALKRWERQGEAIQPEDREAIEFLGSQTTPVDVCAGCMVYPESQGALLARMGEAGDIGALGAHTGAPLQEGFRD